MSDYEHWKEMAVRGNSAAEKITLNSLYGKNPLPEYTEIDAVSAYPTTGHLPAANCDICGHFPHISETHRQYYIARGEWLDESTPRPSYAGEQIAIIVWGIIATLVALFLISFFW